MYNDIINNVVKTLNEKHYSYQEVIDIIKKTLEEYSSSLNIGKVKLEVNSRENIYNNELNVFTSELYNSDKIGEGEKIVYQKDIQGGGSFVVNIYPENEFTQEEKICINNLCYILSKSLWCERYEELIDATPLLDSLTGLRNTQGINAHLGMLIARGLIDKYSILFTNIKDCKTMNNMVGGVQNGDVLLLQYVDKIKNFLEPDELIGRHGGDNFTIIVKKENLIKLLNFLEKISVSASINGKEYSIDLETKVGIFNPNANSSVYDIMYGSSTAMYISKKLKNVNIVTYDGEVKAKCEMIKKIKGAFASAVNENRITAFYQPKVDLLTNELVGSEALARWYTEEGKLLSPALFVEALEQDNKICELDFIILNDVCQKLRHQIDDGIKPVPVSVNFSRYHFINGKLDNDFIEKIIDIIDAYDLDHQYIQVEFTESGKLDDYEMLRKYVDMLHANDIKVLMDDFGTGYSSLQLLEQVDFDVIKMDKSFADCIGTEAGNIIFKYISQMVSKLGKEVVCEGVELQDQIDYLKEIRCNIIQGYYYDKPLPIEQYEERLSTRSYK